MPMQPQTPPALENPLDTDVTEGAGGIPGGPGVPEDAGNVPEDAGALDQFVLKGGIELVRRVGDEYKNLENTYNVGRKNISNSKLMADISFRNISIEEKRALFAGIDKDVSGAERYRQQLEGQNTVPGWVQRTLFDGLSMVPIIREVGERSIAYGVAGAATVGGHALVVSGGNPVIGLAGAVTGYGLGAPIGGFHAGLDLAYGPMYKNLVQTTRLTDDQAKGVAFIGGAVSAQLESMSFGVLRGLGGRAAATVLRSPGAIAWTAKALANKASKLGLDISTGAVKESLIEAAQTLTEQSTLFAAPVIEGASKAAKDAEAHAIKNIQTLAEHVNLIVAAMLENTDLQKYVKFAGGPDSVVELVIGSFLAALGPSAILGGAASGAGTVVGGTAKKVNNASYKGQPISNIINSVLRSVQGETSQNPNAVTDRKLLEHADGSFSLPKVPANFTINKTGNIVLDKSNLPPEVPANSTTIDGDGNIVLDESNLPPMVGRVEENVPQVEENVPQVEGDVPQVEGDVPQVEGDVPQVEGDVPQVEGNVPQVEGDVPQVEGNVPQGEVQPQVEGNVPQGEVQPQVEGNVPQGEVPTQVGGNVPQAGAPPQNIIDAVTNLVQGLQNLRTEDITEEDIAQAKRDGLDALYPKPQVPDVPPPKTQVPEGEQIFKNIDEVDVRPLAPVEQQARLTLLGTVIKAFKAPIRELEKQIDAQTVVNERAEKLREDISALTQEKNGNAAQIRKLEADVKAHRKANKPTANIEKSLAKAKAKQAAVIGKISDAKTDLDDLTPGPVKAMEDRLMRLYEGLDAAQFETDLIDVGLADPEEVRQEQGQLKIQQIAKMIDALAKAKRRTETARDKGKANSQKSKEQGLAVGKRVGALQALREASILAKQLRALVRLSGLSQAAQKKLLVSIPPVVTVDKMQGVLRAVHMKIMDMQEKEVKTKLMARIDKLLDDKKIKAGQVPKGRTTAETVATLKIYKELIDDPDARAAVIADYLDREQPSATASTDTSGMTDKELEARESRAPLSESEQEAAQIALRLDNFETFDGEQLGAVAKEIADIITEGRVEARKRQEERAARAKELIDLTKENLSEVSFGDTWGLDKLKEQTGGWYSSNNSGWSTLVNALTPNKDLVAALDELPSRMEMDKGLATVIQNVSDIVQATLKEGGENSTINEYAAKGAGAIFKAPINVKGLGLFNKNSVLHMYANFYTAATEPDVRASLEAAGLTFKDTEGEQSTEAAIERHLTDTDKQVVENTIQYLTEVGYNRFNEVFRKENGVDLPKVKRYYPKKVKPATTKETQIGGNGPVNPSSIMPSAAKTRGTHKRPLKLNVDFFSNISQHLTSVEHYRAYAPWVRDTNSVFTDTEVRERIEKTHGRPTLAAFDSYRARITSNSRYDGTLNIPGVDWFRGLKVIDALGGKAIMAAKVFASGNLVTMDLSPTEWAAGVAGLAKNWGATQDILHGNASLAKRSGGSANDDLRVATSSTAWTQFEKEQNITSVMMLALPLGDSFMVSAHGGILYNAELAKGRTSEEALTEVVRKVEETQGSSSIAETTPILASSNVARLVGMFTNQQNQIRQILEVASRNFSRAMSDPNANRGEAFKVYMGKLANVAFATEFFSLIGSAVRSFGRPEDEPWEETVKREAALHAIGLLSSLTGGAFLVGQAAEMAVSAIILPLMGQKKYPAPRFSIWDTEAKIIKAAEDLIKSLGPQERRTPRGAVPIAEKALLGALDTIGFFLRIPLDTLLKNVTMSQAMMAQDDPVGAAFAFTGANKQDLEQRQPKRRQKRERQESATVMDTVLEQVNALMATIRGENTQRDDGDDEAFNFNFDSEATPPPSDTTQGSGIVKTNLTDDFKVPEANPL